MAETENHYSNTPASHVSLRLRREPIDLPRSIRLSRVPKSVVQTIGTALPKFHFIRLESITAPVRRQWYRFITEALSHHRHARIEHTPAIEHLALTRRPCAQLASDGARMKITLRLFTRGLFHVSTDTNLPVKFDPVKPKRGVWIGLELFSLRAFIIRKEHEAILIEALQQNDSHRRSCVAIRRRKAHRIDVVNAGLNRGGEPIGELLDRVAIKVASAQPSADVLVPRSGRIAWDFHYLNKRHGNNSVQGNCHMNGRARPAGALKV